LNKTDIHNKVTVYSPESGLRKPGQLFREMFRDWTGSFELGWRLFLRDRKAMYRQSVLGLLWAFIPPIMTTLVWVFLNGQRIINIDDPGVPYPAFVLTSTLLWSVFAKSINMPNAALSSGKSIMIKINFNKESLMVAGFLQIGADFLVKLTLIVGVFIVFKVTPALTIFLAPLGVLMLALLGVGIGLVLLPVSMMFTDVSRLMSAVLPFWMLLTPVIYPTPRGDLGKLLNSFNPVAPILSTTRDWMFTGQAPYLHSFLVVGVGAVVLTFIGVVLFRLAIPFIIERSGG